MRTPGGVHRGPSSVLLQDLPELPPLRELMRWISALICSTDVRKGDKCHEYDRSPNVSACPKADPVHDKNGQECTGNRAVQSQR